MPDCSDILPSRTGPGDWNAAFAALPLEKPAEDAWPRIARRFAARAPRGPLARRERRITWLIGTASAAVLLVAVWAPLSRWRATDVAARPAASIAGPGISGTLGPAAPVSAPPREPDAPVETRGEKASPPAAAAVAAVREDARRDGVPPRRAAHPRHLARKAVPRAAAVAIVAADSGQDDAARTTASAAREAAIATATDATADTAGAAASHATGATADSLSQLQARSAQLEALVALARDDRVGSAGSALITAALDARIATVDATLSQSGLDTDRRQALWDERVQLLQQLAGIESTARWLAAHGTLHDAALVSVD